VTGLPLARWRPGPCSVIIVETALGLPGLPKISPEATAPPFIRCLFTCVDFVSVEARTAAAGPVLDFFERARVVFHLLQRATVGSPGLFRIAPPPPEWLGFCVAVFVLPEQRRRFSVCLLPQSRCRSFLGSLPQASPFFPCFFNGPRVVRYRFLPKRAAGFQFFFLLATEVRRAVFFLAGPDCSGLHAACPDLLLPQQPPPGSIWCLKCVAGCRFQFSLRRARAWCCRRPCSRLPFKICSSVFVRHQITELISLLLSVCRIFVLPVDFTISLGPQSASLA
jgi:hypothetical protein